MIRNDPNDAVFYACHIMLDDFSIGTYGLVGKAIHLHLRKADEFHIIVL